MRWLKLAGSMGFICIGRREALGVRTLPRALQYSKLATLGDSAPIMWSPHIPNLTCMHARYSLTINYVPE